MITIALPSKGRMKEDASAVLERAGLKVASVGNDRSYRGRIEGRDDIEVAYLSASEIAREIGAGTVDFGVTGEDLVREGLTNADAQVEFCARLGFGHADVVVAVPEIWLDVDSMADLGDVASEFRARHGRRLAIATKYWRLTQQFFHASTAFSFTASSKALAPLRARLRQGRRISSSISPPPARR